MTGSEQSKDRRYRAHKRQISKARDEGPGFLRLPLFVNTYFVPPDSDVKAYRRDCLMELSGVRFFLQRTFSDIA